MRVGTVRVIAMVGVLLASSAWTYHHQTPIQNLDPAAWGRDHVGQPVPEYLTGDECLFCHRDNVGPGWQSNRHNLAMHELNADAPGAVALRKELGDASAAEVKIELGGRRLSRFLKPG